MDKKIVWSIILFLNVSLMASASSDDGYTSAKPVIRLKELGSGHGSAQDKVGYIGANFHLTAEIVAKGLVKQIEIKVQEKKGSYKFNKVYDNERYVGKENMTFHVHLEIPLDAASGEYYLYLTVTDRLGQQTTVKSDLVVKKKPVK